MLTHDDPSALCVICRMLEAHRQSFCECCADLIWSKHISIWLADLYTTVFPCASSCFIRRYPFALQVPASLAILVCSGVFLLHVCRGPESLIRFQMVLRVRRDYWITFESGQDSWVSSPRY